MRQQCRGDRERYFDVTPGQSDILLHHLENPSLSVPMTSRYLIHGALDVSSMVRSMRYVSEANQALSSTFRSDDKSFSQAVGADPRFDECILLIDVGDVGPDRLIRYGDGLLRSDSDSWNIWQDPPIRFRLIRARADLHLLLLTIQHVVINARGMAALERGLFAAYQAYVDGGGPPPADPDSYRSAVEAQRPSPEAAAADQKFWERMVVEQADSVPAAATPRGAEPLRRYQRRIDKQAPRAGRIQAIRDVSRLMSGFGSFIAGGCGIDGANRVTIDMHLEHCSARHRDVVGMFSVVRPVTLDLDRNGHVVPETALDRLFATMKHKSIDSSILRSMEHARGLRYGQFPSFNYLRHQPASRTVRIGNCTAERAWYTPRQAIGRPAQMHVYESGSALAVILSVDPFLFTEEMVDRYFDTLIEEL